MSRRFEVLPGRGDRWLVRDGSRRFSVPADLGERLRGPDGRRHWRELLAGHAGDAIPRRTARGLWMRITVVPGALVRHLSWPLRPLAATPWLGALALSGIAVLAATPHPSIEGTVAWPSVLAVFLLTVLAHELGHAAALAREGWPPGGIGVGMLWVLPVCWCDVSAVALLPRRGRVRVDLAGVAFQLAAAGLAMLVATIVDAPAVFLGARLAVAAVVWSLLPIARTDGYWLACDLLDLPDLEAPLSGEANWTRRILSAAWRFFTVLSMAALVGLLLWRLHGWLDGVPNDKAWPAVLVRGLVGSVALVGILRTAGRMARLLGAARRDLRP